MHLFWVRLVVVQGVFFDDFVEEQVILDYLALVYATTTTYSIENL
jgi:hypothetical protein